MHITGIIAEYNPLHLGHQYHIEQTRSLVKEASFDTDTGSNDAHYIVTVLSGDFVQRGLPAIVDKHTRTRMALEAGSDLVLELPVPYALSSGEGFGFGGVSLLHQLGCVDTLSFGTEEGALDALMDIAKVLIQENGTDSVSIQTGSNTPYNQAYQTALKQGLTHPAARMHALSVAYPELDLSVLDGQSNNMLALEYCKALYRLNSAIQPLTVKRMGQGYLENAIASAGDVHFQGFAYRTDSAANTGSNSSQEFNFASATAIRETLKQADYHALQQLSEKVPPFTLNALEQANAQNSLLHLDDFSLLLHYKLLSLSKVELTDFREITPDFANKIMKHLPAFESFTQFANLLWTKEMTYARVCRNLMHIILSIKENTWDVHLPVPYARVLGFRKESAPLLSEIKKNAAIPLITKLADAEKILSSEAYSLLNLDMKAAHIYDSLIQQKVHVKTIHEMQKQIVII